jgi:iron complex outermembrane receptor protein
MSALKFVLLAGGAALLFASFASTCNAQTAAAATTSQSDAEASTGLQEVVVTAQRRSESGQRVPVPITAIGAAQLQAQGVGAITDLQTAVPSLQTATAGNSVTTFLRGVGSVVNAPGADPEVALYVDGVYYPSPAAANFSFNNIASIEVDKGPQGTLFGRNATGGVIQINTLDPGQAPRFDMTLGYANYKTNEETLYASGGLRNDLAADVSVYNREQGGWGHNLYTGASIYVRQESAVRSKWVYTPTDATTVTFIADYDHNLGYQGAALNVIRGTTVTGGTPQPFYDVSTDTKASESNTQYGFSLKIGQDFGWMRLLSISADRTTDGFLQLDTDESPVPFAYLRAPQIQKTYTQ